MSTSPSVLNTLLRSRCRDTATYFLQSCRKAHWVLDNQQYQVGDRCPSYPRRGGQLPPGDFRLCLECSNPRGPPWPTQCGRVSQPKESREDLQEFLETWSHSPKRTFENTTKYVTRSSSRNEISNVGVFLCRRKAANISRGQSKHSLVLLRMRMHGKVCDVVFLEKECQLIE